MVRYPLFLLIFPIIISGCAKLNKNPDILLQEPYNRVQYIAEPEKHHEVIDVVQVTTRGAQANILNTIPKLYEKALARFPDKEQMQIGNINITLFTQRESFEVLYDDCRPVKRLECSDGVCTTRHTEECTTETRTEIIEVLYQKASADILTLRGEF